MIRMMVLAGLLAVIFYCAVAGSARAAECAACANAPAMTQAQRQFIPGSMAALCVGARAWIVSAGAGDPNG